MIYSCVACQRLFHELLFSTACPHCGSTNWIGGSLKEHPERKPITVLKVKDHEADEDKEYTGYIGLSMSQCVKSIARGEISMKDVMCVISRTDLGNPHEAYQAYERTAFAEFDKGQIITILVQMWTRLVQPRQFYGMTPIGNNPWICIQAYPGVPYKGVRE